MIVNGDPTYDEPSMIISGRSERQVNAHLNGVYVFQSDTWNGRNTYKLKTRQRAPLYLYYLKIKNAWAIGDSVGSQTPIAYCTGIAITPDLCKESWCVYSKNALQEHPATAGRELNFEVDENIQCNFARSGEHLDLLSQPMNERALQMTRIIASSIEFEKALRVVTQAADQLSKALPLETVGSVVGNVAEIGTANAAFISALMQTRHADPLCNNPVGPMLLQSVPLLHEPFLRYCSNVVQRIKMFQELMSSQPTARATIIDPLRVASAMESPFLQIQRYPHFIQALFRASASDPRVGAQADLKTLNMAQQTF